MSGYQWAAQSAIEPVSGADAGQWGNAGLYSVVSGCTLSYSAGGLTVDLAAGFVMHFGSLVTVPVAAAGFTIVSDPSNPRWTWLCISSTGTPVVVSGTASATPSVPSYGDRVPLALLLVQANQTIAANITYKLNHAIPTPGNVLALTGLVKKRNALTQVITASTVLVDVVAVGSPATMSFPIAANEIWVAEYWIPLSFGGTGGAKFQLTGPSTPTAVTITGFTGMVTGAAGAEAVMTAFSPVTAFATDISARSGVAGLSAGSYYTLVNSHFIQIITTIVNGANAGTVTLQAAQNSSNSTTTIGLGAWMRAERFA